MERKSGVLMHISSLWGDYSEGSFGKEAKQWIDFLSDCGFGLWQVLPFCLPDECNSPYKSFSAFSPNPFFVDLPSLYEEGLLTKEELDGAKQNTPYSCEFKRLKNERLSLLKKAAMRCCDGEEINSFMKKNPQTEKFARFMALRESNGKRIWSEWTNDVCDSEELYLWYFISYKFFTQWAKIKEYANEKNIKIIGDIPIYVDLDSADVWANPKQFQLDKDNKPSCVAGVPPDYFSADGQLWGNPLYDWSYMQKDGYSWWQQRISFMTELFDGVRIDHFRGLESYYSIPFTEKTAKNGKWVKGPGMKLINAIKPLCENKMIIAEDLGDITDEVRELVKESGFPGMRVLQFAFLGDESSPHLPHNYDNNCIAYTGTHDNNTLLGYVWELDDASRNRLIEYCGFKGEGWNECYDDILRTMLQSHAGTVIFPVQDLLLYGSDTRLNRPGSSEGNWSFRVTYEQLSSIDKEKFKKWNKLYQRN